MNEKLASLYAKFRTGKAFLIALALLVGNWLLANTIWPWFDPGLGHLNLFLSTEASISTAMLMAATDKQDRRMLMLIEAMYELLKKSTGNVHDAALDHSASAGLVAEKAE